MRRTASFGDAVPRLSYSSQHRQESPWKDAAGGRGLLHPRSAHVGDGLDRGRAVFMLRSVDAESGGGSSVDADSASQPVPTPRLAACISLPTMPEGSPAPALPPLAEEEAAGECDSEGPLLGLEPPQEGGVAALPQPGAQQHATPSGSAAAADAAAAAAQGTGPVFVPICLAVPDEEYELLLQDWLARQAAADSGGCWDGEGGAAAAGEAARRLRALQERLRGYATWGVPVVEMSLTDMGQALDSMHRYVLQCIALALGESNEDP